MEGRVAYPMDGPGSSIFFEEQRFRKELVGMNCLFVKIYSLGRKKKLFSYLVVLLYPSLTLGILLHLVGQFDITTNDCISLVYDEEE